MITSEGKTHIKRYLAGFVPLIAESIAVGVGSSAESVDDDSLQFEIGRANIILTSFDFVNDRLVFRAKMPNDLLGTIHEVGLYSTSIDSAAGEFGSKLLVSFDSDTETWTQNGTTSTFVTTGQRIGADTLRQAPTATNTVSDILSGVTMDLSGHSASDKFVLAYNVGNTFLNALSVRFHTDASNYYQLSLPSVNVAGYKVTEVSKSAASVTGTPDWANITEIRVLATSAAGGTGIVDWDGIRIEDEDTLNADYVLVSRKVLATPYTRVENKVEEIEFTLDVNL